MVYRCWSEVRSEVRGVFLGACVYVFLSNSILSDFNYRQADIQWLWKVMQILCNIQWFTDTLWQSISIRSIVIRYPEDDGYGDW